MKQYEWLKHHIKGLEAAIEESRTQNAELKAEIIRLKDQLGYNSKHSFMLRLKEEYVLKLGCSKNERYSRGQGRAFARNFCVSRSKI